MFRFIVFGDVIGTPGLDAIKRSIKKLRNEFNPDFMLCNGENLAEGFGITHDLCEEVVGLGFDGITSGNHWHDQKEEVSRLESSPYFLRPANMHNVRHESAGLKYFKLKADPSCTVAVVNLIGRVFMIEGSRCPFETASRLISQIPKSVKIILVDFHAEASSEKQSMAHFLDGKATLIYGTHGHVPTSDERVLASNHTGFCTDVGMTGAYDSVIGMDKVLSLRRFLVSPEEKKKIKLSPATDRLWVSALIAEVDKGSGRCHEVKRILWKLT